MAGMGFMIAAASRSRDSRGRYAEGEENRRMEGNYGNNNRMESGGGQMYGGTSRMGGEMEMRRQRDSHGRYMEGGGGSRMEDEGNQGRMEQGGGSARYWPYLEKSRMTEEPDGQNPYGGQPEVYRKQEEQRSGMEMRRMEGKTSGGEINYNRPDGGYGNVRYFMHKTDPLNQRDGKEHMMGHQRLIGFRHDEREGGELDRDTVMEWVQEMEDADGVKGGKYTWHQAQQYALNVGITSKPRQLEFYWAMNAMYADYAKVAKKFGVDKPEFYACLAKAFLEDPDAVEDKVEMYYKYIVRHE